MYLSIAIISFFLLGKQMNDNQKKHANEVKFEYNDLVEFDMKKYKEYMVTNHRLLQRIRERYIALFRIMDADLNSEEILSELISIQALINQIHYHRDENRWNKSYDKLYDFTNSLYRTNGKLIELHSNITDNDYNKFSNEVFVDLRNAQKITESYLVEIPEWWK